MSVKHVEPILYDYCVTEDISDIFLHRCEKVKDLEVIIDRKLSFEDHIIEKINKAYSILGLIKRNFAHPGNESFVLLYTSMLRSHFEFSNSVWSPYKVGLIEMLEKVQKEQLKWYQLTVNYHILID